MLTMFREGDKDSPISMRRVLAFAFALFSICLFIYAIPNASNNWYVFIPGTICVIATLLLLFFTTWADVAGAVKTIAGKE